MTLVRLRGVLVGTATVMVVVGLVVGAVPTAGEDSAAGKAAVQAEGPPTPVWNETFGRSANDGLNAVVPADDGGYLLVGETDTAGDGLDGWLIAVDESGDRRFEETFGGPGDDRISDAVATDDGYLIAGWRMVDGEGIQGWLLKVDDRGVEQWSETYGGSQWDGFWEIAEGSDGEYVAVGRHQSTGWAVAVDEEGDEQWNRTYAGSANASTFTSVAATEDGYLLGGYGDTGDGVNAGTAVRIDESGDEEWSQSYGADDGTRVTAVANTEDSFLLAGTTNLTEEQPRAWATLVGDDGSVETRWTDDLSGSRFLDAVPVEEGFLLVGGADRSDSSYDALMTRFDDDLDRQWETIDGGAQWDIAFSGATAGDGYVVCGATSSAGAGGLDGWVVKFEDGEASE